MGSEICIRDRLNCGSKTHTAISDAAAKALNDFKNPYQTGKAAVTDGGTSTANGDEGFTRVVPTNSTTITITTCVASACSTAENVKTNTVAVE